MSQPLGKKPNQNQPQTESTTVSITATSTPTDPLVVIQSAIDAIPEASMATWAIESLCKATHATQYRPLFREAAQQHGEAGVYRLLQTMIRFTGKVRHNQLVLASGACVAAARTNGKGILPADRVKDLLPAMVMANRVAAAARKGCTLIEVGATPLVEMVGV